MAKEKDGYIELEGKVLEVLPGGDFKVKLMGTSWKPAFLEKCV